MHKIDIVIRAALVSTVLILLSNCSSIPSTIKSAVNPGYMSRKTAIIVRPEIDTIVNKSIGDEILHQRQGEFVHDLSVLSEYKLNDDTTVLPGIFKFHAENGKIIKYKTLRSPEGKDLSTLFDKRINQVTINGITLPKEIYEFLPDQNSSSHYTDRTLLFGGYYGNKIKITYREYINGMARPAFTHDVEYDLTESKIIAYKGSLIEIINVSNTGINYKVISGF